MRLLLALVSLLIVPAVASAQPRPLPDGYLSTRGSQIAGADGMPVRIAAIGWNGADSLANVPQGLDRVSMRQTMQQMVSVGFNTVRIAFSDRMLDERPAPGAIDQARNPDLAGLSALQLLDKIVRMNRAWGYLVTQDIAPVFVGEMGSSMLSPESKAWAKTMTEYLNGTAPGGIRLQPWQLPVSAGWWAWGDMTGDVPRGVLVGGWDPKWNRMRSDQKAVWERLLFEQHPDPVVPMSADE